MTSSEAPERAAARSSGRGRDVAVSVVVPCYNSLPYLPETVASILGQDHRDLELVLVDDGGTDDLAGWVAAQDDPRLRLVRQDNAGPSAARNTGIAESTGELVAFLDSDDTWEPDFLSRLVACFDDERVGMAYSGWDVIDAEGRPNGRATVSTWEGDVWERFVTRNPVACSGAVVRRAVFDDVGDFAVNRDRFPIDVEDWEMWVRIASSYPVAVVPEVLAHHRRHDTNSSSNPESLHAAYDHFLDTVFLDQPPERQALRPQATARAEIVLAWHSLADLRDAPRALAYRRSAARHAPEVRRSGDYWRLGAAAWSLRAAGDRGFRAVRSVNEHARRALGRLPLDRLRREGTFTP
ncbi:glycosyltransferase family 2 protein [Dermatobacter hominis]|uniref:glycosyltransferase family 2 protein n=1 Tax=Dermatobacter hominis TaxID=2884263 RepID=UPI001D121A0B|nr:glycosyltransferase family 2 protein [Dermatobacter hominis]UDY34116.1 glycosyltransferase [Dermatobacter hominis]